MPASVSGTGNDDARSSAAAGKKERPGSGHGSGDSGGLPGAVVRLGRKTAEHLSAVKDYFVNDGNYAYAVARVKSRKGQLVPNEMYERLMMMDIHEINRFLSESHYAKAINDLATRYEGLDLLERALNRDLEDTNRVVLDFCEGGLKKRLSLYLERYDIYNAITIIRGKFTNTPEEEISQDLVAAGTLTRADLNEMIALTTIDDACKRLEGTPLSTALAAARARSGSAPGKEIVSIPVFEDELYKHYYATLVKELSMPGKPNQMFLEFVMREIDMVNLKTILRFKVRGGDHSRIAPHLVEGGALEDSFLKKMADAPDFQKTVAHLKTFKFFSQLTDELANMQEHDNSLIDLLRELDRIHLRSCESFSRKYPLSILPIVNFLVRKKTETDSIRIIARGKATGLPLDEIREQIIII